MTSECFVLFTYTFVGRKDFPFVQLRNAEKNKRKKSHKRRKNISSCAFASKINPTLKCIFLSKGRNQCNFTHDVTTKSSHTWVIGIADSNRGISHTLLTRKELDSQNTGCYGFYIFCKSNTDKFHQTKIEYRVFRTNPYKSYKTPPSHKTELIFYCLYSVCSIQYDNLIK